MAAHESLAGPLEPMEARLAGAPNAQPNGNR
jgi:hypothetical protein